MEFYGRPGAVHVLATEDEMPKLERLLNRADRRARQQRDRRSGKARTWWPDMAGVEDMTPVVQVISYPHTVHEQFATWLQDHGVYFMAHTPALQAGRGLPPGWEYRVYTFGIPAGMVPVVHARIEAQNLAVRPLV